MVINCNRFNPHIYWWDCHRNVLSGYVLVAGDRRWRWCAVFLVQGAGKPLVGVEGRLET